MHTVVSRLRLPLSVAALSLLGVALMPRSAYAIQGCFHDPLVTFPNGITVDMHAWTGDAASDVQHISYVLHGPKADAGSGYSIVYPDGSGPVSSFTYVTDGQAHQYYADVTVTTTTPSVPVTAYLDWTAGGKHNTGTA